jgi:hypothetical protein
MVPPNALLPDFSLPFYPLNLRRQYGLSFHIRQNGQQQKIQHQLDVFCNTDTQEGDFLFQLDKKQVYINDQAPDALLDEIADRCGKLLYPLQVLVSRQGRFKGIQNAAAIRQRWQGARPQLAQEYSGKIAQEVLSSMDATLVSDPVLADAISQDWLFTLLLPPLYHTYQNYEAAAELSLPRMAYRQPVPYRLQLKAQPQLPARDSSISRQAGYAPTNWQKHLEARLWGSNPTAA